MILAVRIQEEAPRVSPTASETELSPRGVQLGMKRTSTFRALSSKAGWDLEHKVVVEAAGQPSAKIMQ